MATTTLNGEWLQAARLMVNLFRGRNDHVAKATPEGTFGPAKLPKPMRAEWLERHLGQSECLGFYLMTPESKVWCSCADFDNHPKTPDPEYRDKAEAVYLWLQKVGVASLVEISQSGVGVHLWIFFEEPTPAWVARAWWRLASEKAGAEIVEVYPRQDTLSGKGMGNLVRYPLWNQSRFADPENDWTDLNPLEAMAEVRRISGAELKDLAFRMGAELRGDEPRPVTGEQAADTPEDDRLPARVKDRLGKSPHSLLARRWKGDMNGLKDQSRSSLAQAIACELVRQYVPTGEIAAALRFWCAEQDYEKGERSDWISRTVGKAYEFVLQRLEEKSASAMTMQSACHAYLDTLERGETLHLASGIPALDASIDGVAPGEMCVIAARPSHGKSTLALQWLDHAAGNGIPGLLISEEMGHLELGKRSCLSITLLDSSNWDSNTLPAVRQGIDQHYVNRAPIHLVENCESIDRCEDVIDQFCGVHGVRLVAVDYLQLLGARGQKRYEQVSEVSRRLKQCAKRNNVGMLALCQMNREVESRGQDRYPRLSDLRDTGQLEQDADLVLFLQWPWLYDRTLPEADYKVYVGKRRNGRIGQWEIATTFSAGRQHIGPFTEAQEPQHADAF